MTSTSHHDSASNSSESRSILILHPGSELYGSDRVMLDTAAALVRRGWTVTVSTPEDGPLVAQIEAAGAAFELCPTPVLRKSALRNPLAFLSLVLEAARCILPGWRLLRARRPALVYVSTVTIPLWIVLARCARRPVVGHVHEAEQSAPGLVKKAMAAPLLAARVVLVNSEFSLGVLTDALPRLRSRCQVVPNAVPGPPQVTEGREALSPPIRLVYVGRLSPRKGPQHVLGAVVELRARGIDTELAIAGSAFRGYEPFEAELHERVETEGLVGRVRFLGFCDDVWPLLSEADIAIVPSVAPEPFGNTAVEAVLAARPVVTTTSGGLPEAVLGYESARSVEPGSSTAIADAVADIAADWSVCRQRAIADAVTAARRHDPETYADTVERALLTAVGGS